MAKILVVEDDSDVALCISDALQAQRHIVEDVSSGAEASSRLRHYEYDLLILDWELPEVSGVELCQRYRRESGQAPVLMLTGRNTINDKEVGLDAGADDYLTKPFSTRELIARVRALLRRADRFVGDALVVGPITLDSRQFKVTKDGAELRLLPKEFSLLEFLMRNKNQYFSAEQLLDRVWSCESEASSIAVRQCIKRLREKVDSGEGESFIVNRMGKGYAVLDQHQ